MKQFYIYIHCRPNGEPFYVGKGKGFRAYDFTHRKQHHKNVIAKHGKERILIYTRNCESEAQAHAHEIWMIAWCRAQGYRLTNMTDGGEGMSGHKHTKQTCIKIKIKRAKQKIKHSDETKIKIGIANKGKLKGRKNPKHSERLKGRKHSIEHKLKISAALCGQKRSMEARKNMSNARKGYIVHEQARLNMSIAHVGKKPSQRTRRRMRASQLERWAKIKGEKIGNSD